MKPIESDELEFLRTFRDYGIVVYDPTRTLHFQKPFIVKENEKDDYDKSDGKYNKSER